MKSMVIVLLAVCLAFLADKAAGDCCYKKGGWVFGKGQCRDCTAGTPYCGVGRCNLFGCSCNGGCRNGKCGRKRTVDEDERVDGPADIFNQIDLNQ